MIYIIIKSFLFFLLMFIYIVQAIPIKQNNLNSTRNNTLLVKSLHHVNKHNKHKKRCHYTDKSSSLALNKDIDDLSATSYSLIKQQRVRDQHQNRNHNHHHHSFIQMDQTESEKLYVNIGDTINLTCIIDTKEIDWHFKDNNLTTTILSYGLQLQVASQASSAAAQYNDFNDLLVNEHQKYKVTSDRQSIHMITVRVQGNQDEGSYQCVDSKSEIPVKKTIRVILSNN